MAHYDDNLQGAANLFQRGHKLLAVERLVWMLRDAGFKTGLEVHNAADGPYIDACRVEVFIQRCINVVLDDIRETGI